MKKDGCQENVPILWLYPIVVWCMQIVSPVAAFAAGILFCSFAMLQKKVRASFLLFGLTTIGHSIFVFFAEILSWCGVAGYASVIVGRLGLIGYFIAFAAWWRVSPLRENFFQPGNVKASICFPFVWKGKKELIWRFLLIFSGMCFVPIGLYAVLGNVNQEELLAGVLFTFVNATLEELLWRGLILPRTISIAGEKKALIITALAFGLYHISLGFPVWTCFVFAVGGFYMGGSAIVSKGLLAPWTMHSMVNLVFVCAGLIFS